MFKTVIETAFSIFQMALIVYLLGSLGWFFLISTVGDSVDEHPWWVLPLLLAALYLVSAN